MSTFWCGRCGAALTRETEDAHRCESTTERLRRDRDALAAKVADAWDEGREAGEYNMFQSRAIRHRPDETTAPVNRLADEEQASKDAAMLAARDGAPTLARVCDDDLVRDAEWDALIDDDKLKEKR